MGVRSGSRITTSRRRLPSSVNEHCCTIVIHVIVAGYVMKLTARTGASTLPGVFNESIEKQRKEEWQ
jgi:hypothetical protein